MNQKDYEQLGASLIRVAVNNQNIVAEDTLNCICQLLQGAGTGEKGYFLNGALQEVRKLVTKQD